MSYGSVIYSLQNIQKNSSAEEMSTIISLIEDIIAVRPGENTVLIGDEENLKAFWRIGFSFTGNTSRGYLTKLTPDKVTEEIIKAFHILHLKDNKPNLLVILGSKNL